MPRPACSKSDLSAVDARTVNQTLNTDHHVSTMSDVQSVQTWIPTGQWIALSVHPSHIRCCRFDDRFKDREARVAARVARDEHYGLSSTEN